MEASLQLSYNGKAYLKQMQRKVGEKISDLFYYHGNSGNFPVLGVKMLSG